MTKLKTPKPGAVAKLRELYYQKREDTLTSARKKLEEEIKEKQQSEKTTKKIAKSTRDLETP